MRAIATNLAQSFREPIIRRIALLLMLVAGAVGLILLEDHLGRRFRARCDERMANQWAKRSLGDIIQRRLLEIELDVRLIATATDEERVRLRRHGLSPAKQAIARIQTIEKVLEVLSNGGVHQSVMPANFVNADEFQEQIRYKKDEHEGVVIEVIELAPKLADLERQIAVLAETARQSEAAGKPQSRRALEDRIAYCRKAAETTLLRSREAASEIYRNSNEQLLEITEHNRVTTARVELVEYATAGILGIVSVLMAWILVRQIVRILAERRVMLEEQRKRGALLDDLVRQRTTELERLTRQHELILDGAGEGIFGLDRNGATTFVNPAAAAMLGYRADELLGKQHHDVVHHTRVDGSAHPQSDCPIFATLRDGTVHRATDEVFWRKDGTSLCVSYISTPIREGDEVVGAVVTYQDITDRKHAEDAQRESEERFKTILETLQAGVLVIDAESHTIVEANPTALKMIGAPREKVVGHVCHSYICPGKVGQCPITDRGETVDNAERVLVTADGGRIPVIKTVVPVMLNGRLHLLENFVDISDRKRAEEIIRKRLDSLTRPVLDTADLTLTDLFDLDEIQKIQDGFAEATGVASIITAPDGRPITQPSNFCRLCKDIIRGTEKGLANCMHSDAVLGRPNPEGPVVQPCLSGGLWDGGASICAGDRHIANWLVGQVRNDEQNEERMMCYAREIGADEEAFRSALDEVTVMPKERFDKVCNVLFLMASQLSQMAFQNIQQGRSISERERVEEELRYANREAEAASLAKSEFLANMSHEIRTPMTAILGFADVLLEHGSIGDAPPERIEAARTIKRNGQYLVGIINDILDLSKIEAGKMTVESIECSPCQIVAETMSLARVPAEAKDLPVRVEYAGAIPETIHTDPTRLRQILINLIGNAIKFTEVGSVQLIVQFAEDGDQPVLRFDVADTGLGMSEEQAARLFQPFTQADASTTRKFGGTGLGLTISKRFAEMLGGDIAVVETAEGVGTRIRATVATGTVEGVAMIEDPASATVIAPQDDNASPIAARPGLCGCRILLAEDGPDNQRLISHVLKKAGADVTIAENGKLATEAARSARDQDTNATGFDVILMDMQMPVMDGYAAAGLLRREGYHGPIIALTAHAMEGDREKCLEAGCDDYASKPIDRKKLIETIRGQLQSAAASTGGPAGPAARA